MLGMATGRYEIQRGTGSVDEYGDDVDTYAAVQTNVVGSVIERIRQVYNPSNSRVDTIRTLTGRFRGGTDLQDGDRIKDEKTGQLYVVSSLHQAADVAMKADIVADLSFA